MTQVTVTVSWIKSVTHEVTAQKLEISVNGTVQPILSLAPDVQSYQIVVDEKSHVSVALWATDGVMDSTHVTGSVVVPQVTPPAPPTAVSVTLASVAP